MQITSKSGRKLYVPTPEEDAEINAGIAADPDSPELGDEFFAKARPASEVLGEDFVQAMKRGRGRPAGSTAESTKQKVNLRLDPDLLEALKASGQGWQTRVNTILRREVLGR
jgi:uncharacterized protein (DUF4415 family)